MEMSLSARAALQSNEGVTALLRSLSFNDAIGRAPRSPRSLRLKAFGSGKLRPKDAAAAAADDDPTSPPRDGPTDVVGDENGSTAKCSASGDTAAAAEAAPPESPGRPAPSTPPHLAALKLQKVYRSFRTRRQLADCAVLVEQKWWKILDFALLKHSSVSFFETEQEESTVSRWARARTRAAKVGKGLSKDNKAQKLALQHWLEAIDPRHRYGHNLRYYYHSWLHCSSKQPFFYWLDIGEGKEVDLVDQCPRWKLQHQCIKYLGPREREAYEVTVEDGRLMYTESKQLLDTSAAGSKGGKWIFVLSTTKVLYVGQKVKGKFQHSSFLAGGATSAAGRLVVEAGILKAVWPHSGHYRPTDENFREFMYFLAARNVDLTNVELSPAEEGEQGLGSGKFITAAKFIAAVRGGQEEERPAVDDAKPDRRLNRKRPSRLSLETRPMMQRSISDDELREEGAVPRAGEHRSCSCHFEDCADFCKKNLFTDDIDGTCEAPVPEAKILSRINSKKSMKSYQLGQQMSFKWSTGAGPRIACVLDYPSELQNCVLEQVNLSPRTPGPSRFPFAFAFAFPSIG